MALSEQQVEHVLTVPTALFHEIGHFQGFCADTDKYLPILLDPAYTSYLPRDKAEEDPTQKQLIPYCIFKHGNNIFYYQRGNGQGEVRLQSKRSIGIGGHISTLDQNGTSSVYREGMRREIEEEVFLESDYSETCIGLINDDKTEVGKVHLGVVHIFELNEPKVRARESSILQTGFAPPSQLAGERDQFETWSQICLDELIRQYPA